MSDSIEQVEGEIVDYKPSGPEPTIKGAASDALPNNAVKAPAPDELFHRRKHGARRKYASPEQMQEAIDRYFASCVRVVVNESGESEFFWTDPPHGAWTRSGAWYDGANRVGLSKAG